MSDNKNTKYRHRDKKEMIAFTKAKVLGACMQHKDNKDVVLAFHNKPASEYPGDI